MSAISIIDTGNTERSQAVNHGGHKTKNQSSRIDMFTLNVKNPKSTVPFFLTFCP